METASATLEVRGRPRRPAGTVCKELRRHFLMLSPSQQELPPLYRGGKRGWTEAHAWGTPQLLLSPPRRAAAMNTEPLFVLNTAVHLPRSGAFHRGSPESPADLTRDSQSDVGGLPTASPLTPAFKFTILVHTSVCY